MVGERMTREEDDVLRRYPRRSARVDGEWMIREEDDVL